ncbi:MAG: hypothetical protein KGL69_09615 [Alphaproteobacteria bacterium]|nr:hypothetical protein [Alphaproteobacteria bacterium]
MTPADLRSAQEALRDRRWAEAEALAEAAWAADPAAPLAVQILAQARLGLADAQSAAGQAPAAIATLTRACAMRPAPLSAFIRLGEALKSAGDLAGAEAAFLEGLGLAPDAQALWLGLASVRMARDDRDGARAALARLDADRFGACVAWGQLATLEGAFSEAAEWFARARAQRPDFAPVRLEWARALGEAGDRALAEAELRALGQAGAAPLGRLILALADSAHGRAFLRPRDAAAFLTGPVSA